MGEHTQPDDLENLPLRARGVFEECEWEYRADVVDDSAREWIHLRSPEGGAGSGGVGALPFADVGYKVLGHIGSWGASSGGWSRKGWFRRSYRPSTVSGIVSSGVASVVARFRDGTELQARLLDIGREDVRFFFVVHERKLLLSDIVALDATAQELEQASLEER